MIVRGEVIEWVRVYRESSRLGDTPARIVSAAFERRYGVGEAVARGLMDELIAAGVLGPRDVLGICEVLE